MPVRVGIERNLSPSPIANQRKRRPGGRLRADRLVAHKGGHCGSHRFGLTKPGVILHRAECPRRQFDCGLALDFPMRHKEGAGACVEEGFRQSG